MKTVTVEQAVRAPRERLWQACASAEGLRAWQADEVSGEVAPGQNLLLGWPTLDVAIELEVHVVEHGRRLVFQREDAELELELADGGIRLHHSGAFDDDELEGTLSSWRISLATLAHYLEWHDGQARQVHWAVRPARTSLERAHAFFTLAEAQRSWLARESSGVGSAGEAISLELAWGGALHGRVLSHTPSRDVLLSWQETNQSLLALRTLPAPGQTDERLLVVSWSSWGPLANREATERELDGALARLAQALENVGSA
ncbi:MAG TPA: SRPBCC domain-containing protein [Polyangiaceae bacterium]